MKGDSVIVVQARMGSTRLPNKMMLWFHGYPVIEWVYRRLNQTKLCKYIIFAIPENSTDDVLADHLLKIGAQVYRGSEPDVVSRFCGATQNLAVNQVVRICADNPFVSGSEVDRLIDFFNKGKYDYAYNHIPVNNSYPDGLGAEITDMNVLEKINREARTSRNREHLFNYIWEHESKFQIGTCDPLDSGLAHPELKLDLDTYQDYKKLLEWPVHPDMTAVEIVRIACQYKGV